MSVDTLSVILRALGFIALFQAAGVSIFLALFHREAEATRLTLCRLGTVSAAVAAVALIAQYVLEAARMGGEFRGALDPELQRMVMHSAQSVALSARLLGLASILVGLRRRTPAGSIVGIIGVVMALVSFILIGHTSNHAQRWLLRPLLLIHVFIVAFWFGALLPLYLLSSREPAATAARVLERFSALAVCLVPALLLAGLLLATFLLPNLAALRTSYGALLIVKLTVFSLLMLLAAVNKWRLTPALARGEGRAAASLRRSLTAEFGLIGALLCVTAVLTMFYSPES